MYQLMLGQREVEVQKNIKMKQKITELECEIDKLDTRIHYLNLDMSNKNEELENMKSKYSNKKNENETIILNNRIELTEVKVKVRSIELLNYIYLTLIAISAYYNVKFWFNSC
jgi:chromosome segregation ATPase